MEFQQMFCDMTSLIFAVSETHTITSCVFPFGITHPVHMQLPAGCSTHLGAHTQPLRPARDYFPQGSETWPPV